ncbi:uncharacterized protein A4U43_C04F19460 [Asparagus officinalis]|uniref:Uncharacterized protein n=1 Tax=Asparagus officinalis TaxID=4686 RepID=A0A5P1F6Z6_ASPOF|nr:uncharacterized protein A4U43_C04F19460 [Asparagus officinalis]
MSQSRPGIRPRPSRASGPPGPGKSLRNPPGLVRLRPGFMVWVWPGPGPRPCRIWTGPGVYARPDPRIGLGPTGKKMSIGLNDPDPGLASPCPPVCVLTVGPGGQDLA